MHPKLLDPGVPSVQDLAALPGVDAQVQALNDARRALHAVSPLRHHPVDFVEWVPAADVRANTYNPNSVPPPEFRALTRSIERSGRGHARVGTVFPANGSTVSG